MFKDCFESFERTFLIPVSLDKIHADTDTQKLANNFIDNAYSAYLDAIDEEARELWAQWVNSRNP